MVQFASQEAVLLNAYGLESYESAVHEGKRFVLLQTIARLGMIQARAQQLKQFLKSVPQPGIP